MNGCTGKKRCHARRGMILFMQVEIRFHFDQSERT